MLARWMAILGYLMAGIGFVAASLLGLGVGLGFTLFFTIIGLVGFLDALRRRVKMWFVYGLFWASFYCGVHVIISLRDPHYFSKLTAAWTILIPGVTALYLWFRGGIFLDATIVVSSLDDAGMKNLLNALPDGLRKAFGLNIMLPLWRRMGRSVFSFLRMVAVLGGLTGGYFLFFPLANSHSMFAVFVVGLYIFALTGVSFNWPLWRKLGIIAMFIGLGGNALAPLIFSWSPTLYTMYVGPATSNFASVSHANGTTAWDSGGNPVSLPYGSWLLVTDATPQRHETGLMVIEARPAHNPVNPREGFKKDKLLVLVDDTERQASLASVSSNPTAVVKPQYSPAPSKGFIFLGLFAAVMLLVTAAQIRKYLA